MPSARPADVAPLLELREVAAGYRAVPVFDALNLTVPEGAFLGIVGPTGAGKTTLLRCMLGSLPPLSGEVHLRGEPLTRKRRPRIGYVPQRTPVDGYFPATVRQLILMGLRFRRLPPWPTRDERQAAEVLAERLGIAGCLDHHIRDVSGGQQQRAFLARALIGGPELLILDEPTAGVDIRTQYEVLDLLAGLNRDGMTIVMTTHDLNAVAVHLPEVLCFNGGLIAHGAPAAVFTDAVLAATFGADMTALRLGDRLVVAHASPLR